MMMFNRNGGVDVAKLDAVSTCNRLPQEWTRTPWIRPAGREDVFIPPDWETHPLGANRVQGLIDLAKSTYPDRGMGIDIDTAEKASAAIVEYLAGTTHPAAAP